MHHIFKFETDEEKQSLLVRARKVALLAIQHYDLEWERIQFIQLSDTITYKIETNRVGSYLLRIHSDRLTKEEIYSELLLLEALNRSNELTVPEGVASRDGIYVLEVETEQGYRRPYVTLMRWVEGEHASNELTASHAYNMGALMGRLHEAAQSFNPPPHFARPTWGADSFKRDLAKLERHHARFLTNEGWILYQNAADKILSELEVIAKHEHDYGLIHADLHLGNIVFKDDSPYPIDFGRCGYGYYLYDMAGTILGLSPKYRLIFLEGYESIRKMKPDYVRDLESFFVMFMIENGCHHVSNPSETAGLIEEQPYAQAYIRKYLSGSPFLFEAIEPIKIE